MPKNVGDLGKFIVAKGFKKLPKVQKSPNLITLSPMLMYPHPTLLKSTTIQNLSTVTGSDPSKGKAWSTLVVGDEGCIGPSRKLLCLCYPHPPKKYATHAKDNSIAV